MTEPKDTEPMVRRVGDYTTPTVLAPGIPYEPGNTVVGYQAEAHVVDDSAYFEQVICPLCGVACDKFHSQGPQCTGQK